MTDDMIVTHCIYAHRVIPGLLINQVTMERKNSTGNIAISLETGTQLQSRDLKFSPTDNDTDDGTIRYYGLNKILGIGRTTKA